MYSAQIRTALRATPHKLIRREGGLKPASWNSANWGLTQRCWNSISIPIGDDGKEMTIETGGLARFADGAAVSHLGNTSVLVTAVAKAKRTPTPNSGVPLLVDYRKKSAAAGRIPTNFLRRELGPTDQDILTSRMIDRSIRPLFPKGYCLDTQISCNLLAVDGVNDPDVVALNAASAALAISDIPWGGPLGAVRVGLIDNQVVINPTRREAKKSRLDLVLAGRGGKGKESYVVMVEMGGDDVELPSIQGAVHKGMAVVDEICDEIRNLQEKVGKPKREVELAADPHNALVESVRLLAETEIKAELQNFNHDKISRDVALQELRAATVQTLKEPFPEQPDDLLIAAFEVAKKEIFRELIFETDARCDGRGLEDFRTITSAVDLFPPVHGSSLFQRGQTQVLSTVTFDSPESAFRSDAASVLLGALNEKKFMLHYEFPQYAVNELGAGRAGRRELGHGALAEKALRPVVPADFPFTIRLTAEVLESNGSSSMASVAGGSLALLDAGVKLKAPASGVAVGLVSKWEGDSMREYRILTDLLGIEDYMGDMDFKVAGTWKGFTAIQLDVKTPGIKMAAFSDALGAAVKGKKHVLTKMEETLGEARTELKDNRPIMEKLDIKPSQRTKFLGVGATNLKRLQAETGVQISTDIETGQFSAFAPNSAAMDEAKEFIKRVVAEDVQEVLEFGSVYTAKIVEIRESGVMVTLFSGMTPSFIPNSQLDQRRVGHPSALGLKVGDTFSVKFFGRDPVNGNVRLSRKVLLTVGAPRVRTLFKEMDPESNPFNRSSDEEEKQPKDGDEMSQSNQ